MVKNRSVGLYIFLSIITCGIFGLYWLCCVNDDLNTLSGEKNPKSGGMVILFHIITCGIYGIYWCYCMARNVNEIKVKNGTPVDSNLSILYLILSIVGLEIVVWALMQSEINRAVGQ